MTALEWHDIMSVKLRRALHGEYHISAHAM